MDIKNRRISSLILLCAAIALFASLFPLAVCADQLTSNFKTPPAADHPWVYWFWLNGNENQYGIRADLEAMHKVGIGGVIIMEVTEGAPAGTVAFAGPQWRSLFQYACTEAASLGMKINMNNDAGWCGSGGPWITPALSMQKIVWTKTHVVGPGPVELQLAQPKAFEGYYGDIEVLAFPTPADDTYRIPDISAKSALTIEKPAVVSSAAATPTVAPDQIVDPSKIVNLTADCVDGKLTWNAPPGNWSILRIGHTSTGVENHPSPTSGLGLESDKLSQAATLAQFNGLMAKLVADNGPLVGKSLVSTHIDSWETGSQNWSPNFRADFERLRGYDPLPYLPIVTGRVVGSSEISERFLWDMRQTVSDLIVSNYAAYMRQLAHAHGLRLTIEAYGSPTDDLAYGAQADEPMAEFWGSAPYGAGWSVPLMASAGHTSGKNIIGAESFTSDTGDKWQFTPNTLKVLGDRAFSQGINRFVIHRYAMQMFPNIKPGTSMGPWGIHFERTETWWNQSSAWLTYIARCQYLLRQGRYAADICYLAPEGAPDAYAAPFPPAGYKYDVCSPSTFMAGASVSDGEVTLFGKMCYRILVLPETQLMTPELLTKIVALVRAGATVVGAPPLRSPSLENYPTCDTQVQALVKTLWGDADGKSVFVHNYGLGKVIWGKSPAEILAGEGIGPDFATPGSGDFEFMHRHSASGLDIYFVANGSDLRQTSDCMFRASGKAPELWWPYTGKMERAAQYVTKDGVTTLPLSLDSHGSVFVLFRAGASPSNHAICLTEDGRVIPQTIHSRLPHITKAIYGILSDPSRTIDVTAKLQALIDTNGMNGEFQVSMLAVGDDPAYKVVKTVSVDYTLNGHAYHIEGRDPDTLSLIPTAPNITQPSRLVMAADGKLWLSATQPGRYGVTMASGKTYAAVVKSIAAPETITGPWNVTFPPNLGAPPSITMPSLISWSDSTDPGVRYFSGTGTYKTTFTLSPALAAKDQTLTLDLGDVQVMAEVWLNGHDLGILWKSPYQADITPFVHAGKNTLEVQATNTWINRMIGDENLPPDASRQHDGEIKAWPQWVLDDQPSPTGRISFSTWTLWPKGSPLKPSGLIGPVTITSTTNVPIEAAQPASHQQGRGGLARASK